MVLNKQKGNMYGFVSHTWNPIKGECSHDCKYCYMKIWKQKPIRLVEKELQDDLGKDNFIFVGSSTDMFADDVNPDWIRRVLCLCNVFIKNKYLFQTKNPKAYYKFMDLFPANSILATTIETNRENDLSNAPPRMARVSQMCDIPKQRMVSIEPIMDFDLNDMKRWMFAIKPKFVSIGADSKGHKLPEPSTEKINALIYELRKFTEVKIKPNLKRLEVKCL